MPITVNYDPAAGAVAPSAFEAGAGLYRQRQQEIARDQQNRDRAMQFQAQQAYLDRAFADRQANRNAQQQQQQNLYRQQAQQQELLGNAMQQQMSLASQAMQMQQRNSLFQQQQAAQQQELTQKGLKDGSLRYSTAQKNQMAKLYSDWDKVNQAKNLNPRDRQLAQQELQRQFTQIQPRPVTPDEQQIPIADRFQAETFEDPRFPGTRIGVDQNGKYYPISMIPRGSAVGGGKQEPPRNEVVKAPGSEFSITDPSSWIGAMTGQGQSIAGFYDQAGKFHKAEQPKAAAKGSTTDPSKESAAYYKELMNQANKIYAANKESGMSMQDAKKEAEAVMKDHPMNPANKSSWLMNLMDPSGKMRADNQQAPEMTPWQQKQQITKQYQQARDTTVNIAGQEISGAAFLPDPANMTPEDMQNKLMEVGIIQGQQQLQPAPQQSIVAAGQQGMGEMPQQQAPQQAQPPPDQPAVVTTKFLQILGAAASVDPAMARERDPMRAVAQYENKPVPPPVYNSIRDYFAAKFGDQFDPSKLIEPEDQQLLRILQNAAKQAAKEAKTNPDKSVQNIPSLNLGTAANGKRS